MTLADLVAGLGRLGNRELFRHRGEFRSRSWSYLRAETEARRFAAFLQEQGIGRGERVMLWAPNSPEWAAAFFGCFLSGAVPVPIDLRSRSQFLQDVQQQTAARLLITTRFKPAPELGIPIVQVEEFDRALGDARPDRFRPVPIGEDDLAEILYTSGTTGNPKGVMLTHRNLLSELEAFQPVVPDEPYYRFLSVLPLSHILEQMGGLMLPVSRGGSVVYIGALRPSVLLRALEEEHPNAIIAVPRLLELLRGRTIQEAERNALGRALFARLMALAPALPFSARRRLFWPVHRRLGGHLKYVVSGGAELDPSLERFWDTLGMVVLQGYGLTETASAVTCNRVDARRVGSVGRPLGNQEVRLAPDGEILVRGPNVTPGYYASPEATAESLEDGWLKTGDIGRFDQDGFLYILGRKKEMIVTSAGVNVYPDDVEEVLDRIAGVRASAVVQWQGGVHAVLLLEEGVDPRAVVRDANGRLDPTRQILGYTVWPGGDFPRTATMKVRRASVLDYLRQSEREAPTVLPAEAAAVSPLRRLVADVAHRSPSELAGEQQLAVDLGLGSIDQVELVSRIEQELGVDLPEEELTPETTVAELEQLVGRERQRAGLVALSGWSIAPAMRAVRGVVQLLLLCPLLRRVVSVEVRGLENLVGLSGPHLLAANHTSLMDAPVILMTLPPDLRARTAVAIWAEFFEVPDRPWWYRAWRRAAFYLANVGLAVLPIPHSRIVRPSMSWAGRLADLGWSMLVFPEGAEELTEEITPFKEGVGVMASWLDLPVVPVRVEGLISVLPHGKLWPRPGSASVRFGRPLRFPSNASYLVITRQIEDAVRAL